MYSNSFLGAEESEPTFILHPGPHESYLATRTPACMPSPLSQRLSEQDRLHRQSWSLSEGATEATSSSEPRIPRHDVRAP